MWKLIIRRCLIMIPQLFAISIIIFAMAKAMPGDVLSSSMGSSDTDYQTILEKREELGINDPVHVQYMNWIKNAAKGDLGVSYTHKLPVTEVIADRIWNTIVLAFFTVVITYMIAVPLGVISGRWNDTVIDKAILGYNYLGFATPTFIFGLIMLFLFGFYFDLMPTGGTVNPLLETGSFEYYLSKAYHMILPALSYALISTVSISQYLRSEILDTKVKDYVRTARAKGVTESKLYSRHILRNSFLPIAAFMGYEFTGLIAGNIIIESIYSYPGMGSLFLQSISLRDYSVVTAIILLGSFATLLGTLLSDIIVSIVDPRVRIE